MYPIQEHLNIYKANLNKHKERNSKVITIGDFNTPLTQWIDCSDRISVRKQRL